MLVLTENCVQNSNDLHKYCRAEISSTLIPLIYIYFTEMREMLKHIPVVTYACGYILKVWKYFSQDQDSMSLVWKRNWCLPEGLFQSNILVRETQSKLSKRASKLKKGVFCLTLTLSKHSFQKTHLGNTLASRRSPVEKKAILGVGFSVEAAGLLSSQTFPLLAVCTVGCNPAPRARSSSWNTAFGFSVSGEGPVMV